jgi:pyruvate dehydrogenase E2 component (dihydrolipoamide acetyltransferase)
MHDIAMPRLSDSMEEGTILTWLKEDGEMVVVGEELVEIETDKATMTYAAEQEGALEILAAQGATVAVGTPIARLGEPSEASPAAPSGSVTPLARRIAATHGVGLEELVGTGPRGRVTRADVLAAAGQPVPEARAPRAATPEPAAAPIPAAAAAPDGIQPSRAQQVVARRMTEARASIPDFSVQAEAQMDEALTLRAGLREAAGDEAPAPSVNDLVLRACALALRAHPQVNASWIDGRFVRHDHVHVGFAVAARDTLVVPVVTDADTRSLGDLAATTRRLAERARSGDIAPAELSGGTFTVSNLGMFGMTAISPIINAPQAAILGVGALRAVLARVDGEIADRTLMTLSLTADHRILNGADAARFLAEVVALLERPLRLVL